MEHVPPLAVAVVIFMLASAGVYLINDIADIETDREHGIKKNRPIARGDVSIGLALSAGLSLLVIAFAGAALGLRSPRFVAALAIYAIIAITYSLYLKRIPIVDMLAVTSGFIIRAVSGGILVEVPISKWFVIVVSFGSLFIVAGKRYSKFFAAAGIHGRDSTSAYSSRYLADVRSISAAVTLLGYCLWAFERGEGNAGWLWIELSILPFLAILLRYALIVEDGDGEFPEEILLKDRFILVAGALLALLLAVGIYAS